MSFYAGNPLYDTNATNELIPFITVDGPTDILMYDSPKTTSMRYLAPVYYSIPSRNKRQSDIFPEHYRTQAYFPYYKNVVYSKSYPSIDDY